MKLRRLPETIADTGGLDGPAGWVADQVGHLVPPGPTKDLLSGTWLGHALHPMLTDLPIGFWTSSMALDLLGGRQSRRAADLTLALGIASALPAAAAGLSDYADSAGRERRVGVVHGLANGVALVLYTWSLAARIRGRRARGVLLGLAGGAAATVGGYLGGHLVNAFGLGVDNTAFDHGPDQWTPVIASADLVDGRPVAADARGVAVLLLRQGASIVAVADRCTHRGGPLHEGSVEGGCVTCPWHASIFRLSDGEVVRGPATMPQPAYDTREVGGRVEVRRR